MKRFIRWGQKKLRTWMAQEQASIDLQRYYEKGKFKGDL
jgi:hypothetical protein